MLTNNDFRHQHFFLSAKLFQDLHLFFDPHLFFSNIVLRVYSVTRCFMDVLHSSICFLTHNLFAIYMDPIFLSIYFDKKCSFDTKNFRNLKFLDPIFFCSNFFGATFFYSLFLLLTFLARAAGVAVCRR